MTAEDFEDGRGSERMDEPAGTGVSGGEEPASRPRPGPSPTSRARRAAAAGVEPAVRRPSPAPRAAETRPAEAGQTGDGAPTAAAGSDGAAPAKSPVLAAADPAPDIAVEATDPTRRVHRVRASSPRWLAAVLALLALLLAGVSAWLVIAAPGRAGSVNQREQALSAAKTSVPLILSYDYRTFDADLAKARAQLTGRANTDYVQAMTTTIKPAAQKSKVVVQAQTDGAGVETVSADGKQVSVVVFGEQKVTNTALNAPRIDPFRVRATLNLVGGHWLVSKFDQI
jgi:Mce-associated membrane protein